MGTTILAVRFRGGVVAGADTRTSVSGYVSNRYAAKLTFVLDRDVDNFVVTRPYMSSFSLSSKDKGNLCKNSFDASTCVICRSGSAADTQKLASLVRSELVSRQLVYRIRGTVTHVAALLRTLLQNENNSNMSASLICAGYDHELGRGVIYTVGPGGVVFEEQLWAAGGSGSSYILGHVDSWYKNNYPLRSRVDGRSSGGDGGGDSIPDEEMMLPLQSEEEAIQFVSNAIQLAMERDGSSGGFIRIYVIDRFGKRFVVPSQDVLGIDGSRGNAVFLRNFAPALSPSSR